MICVMFQLFLQAKVRKSVVLMLYLHRNASCYQPADLHVGISRWAWYTFCADNTITG